MSDFGPLKGLLPTELITRLEQEVEEKDIPPQIHAALRSDGSGNIISSTNIDSVVLVSSGIYDITFGSELAPNQRAYSYVPIGSTLVRLINISLETDIGFRMRTTNLGGVPDFSTFTILITNVG